MCNYYFGIIGGRYQLILQCLINMFISLVGILLRDYFQLCSNVYMMWEPVITFTYVIFVVILLYLFFSVENGTVLP